MPYFQKIETNVLVTMVTAHSACCRSELTEEELTGCKTTITLLQSEIESRKQADPVATIPAIIYSLRIP